VQGMKSLSTLALILSLSTPALAQGVTQNDVLDGTFRLGWEMTSGSRMTALHLRLAPQWKTYWRAPGDAGIPPSFDWAGSENVKSVRFHWPTPDVFHTNGIQSVGYHDELVLPIEVIAKDPSRPVYLRAQVELGVCKDICMPASLELTADLAGKGGPDALIAAALRARPATGREAGVTRIACTITPIRDGLRLMAEVTLPPQGNREVVVVEPGVPGVWVSEAEVSRSGDTVVATVEMVPASGAPFALDRRGVTLTVLGNTGRAVEIDGCPAP